MWMNNIVFYKFTFNSFETLFLVIFTFHFVEWLLIFYFQMVVEEV